jgi:3-phenylpropionate/trans-cinnamate dioxygenase ferredoxin subunit
MAEFVKVATVDEIPVGTFKSVEVDFTPVVLIHNSDGFFAVANECTHDSAPIADGRLRRDGREIMCTRHGARFDVRTGAVTNPPAIVPIDTYEVKVDGNDVLVAVE